MGCPENQSNMRFLSTVCSRCVTLGAFLSGCQFSVMGMLKVLLSSDVLGQSSLESM